jgi:hypothetical protein
MRGEERRGEERRGNSNFKCKIKHYHSKTKVIIIIFGTPHDFYVRRKY